MIAAIHELNSSKLGNNLDNIYAGMKLEIPSIEMATGADSSKATSLLARNSEGASVNKDQAGFSFDREMLLKGVNDGHVSIKQSILLFLEAGALSIVIVLFITTIAMRTTRRLESHFQSIYQRASLTETAAQLVHDLRNHLAALRANTKALLVSPQQTQEIVADMDRDIVSLNDKLSAFLDLTLPQQRKETPHWWKKFKKHSPT